MKRWKSWIKGVYDKEGVRPRLLLTGSARLDVYRKGGDSLAGRFHSYRLHPFSIAEVSKDIPNDEALERILQFGGFPEPFLKASVVSANRWRRGHLDRILREDLLDLEKVRDIKSIELLVGLLADRVGSTISYSNLASDLQVSPHTIKHWITILENLYIIFIVPPYSRKINRAILKEPKIYFYDTGRVKDDVGARFENLVACSLLKRQHFLEDTLGDNRGLFYVRDRQKHEVDFLTLKSQTPEWLIEAKVSDDTPSPHLRYFSQILPEAAPIQLVKNLKRELNFDGLMVNKAADWLSRLET